MTKEFNQIKTKTICPGCKKDVSEIWIVKIDSVIGIRYAYICSECESLLKLSKEKITELSVDSFLSHPILTTSG